MALPVFTIPLHDEAGSTLDDAAELAIWVWGKLTALSVHRVYFTPDMAMGKRKSDRNTAAS